MNFFGKLSRGRKAAIGAVAAILLAAAPVFAGTASAAPPPENHAKAAALIDVTSGRILFSQRGDEPMKIASLTKIMTAIVAIEHGNLDDVVTVSRRAAGMEGSSLYLKPGEKMTLHNLLYGLMLRSGNDAAVAIAEHVGGSVEGFVYLMNRKAEELGLMNTHYANPHGLDHPDHYMSANDLARLTAYALHNPVFQSIVRTRVKTAPNPYEPWDYKWINKNKMLYMYEGADGVKTGYTRLANRTLVSSATRDGQQLAAVTLNDGNDWADHRRLLDYGFKHFPLQTVIRKGELAPGTPYAAAETFRYPFADGERERLEARVELTPSGTVPYKLGYRGKLVFLLDGQTIGTVVLKEPSAVVWEEEDGEAKAAWTSLKPETRRSMAQYVRKSVIALLSGWK